LGGGGVYSVDPYLRTPYVYQFNLDIQREINSYTIVDMAYAGSSSHKLTGLYDNNPFIPGQTLRTIQSDARQSHERVSVISITFANVGNANYHSLELGVRGRPQGVRHVGNLSYQFSYTLWQIEEYNVGIPRP